MSMAATPLEVRVQPTLESASPNLPTTEYLGQRAGLAENFAMGVFDPVRA
jgi:hypothetical protein